MVALLHGADCLLTVLLLQVQTLACMEEFCTDKQGMVKHAVNNTTLLHARTLHIFL